MRRGIVYRAAPRSSTSFDYESAVQRRVPKRGPVSDEILHGDAPITGVDSDGNAAAGSSRLTILSLSTEILIEIYKLLPDCPTQASFALTCRTLARVASLEPRSTLFGLRSENPNGVKTYRRRYLYYQRMFTPHFALDFGGPVKVDPALQLKAYLGHLGPWIRGSTRMTCKRCHIAKPMMPATNWRINIYRTRLNGKPRRKKTWQIPTGKLTPARNNLLCLKCWKSKQKEDE